MKLSVVIPARNEEGNIEQTLIGLRNHLDSAKLADFELLVVDDGSTDATYPLVQALNAQDKRIQVIQNPGKHGFGRAVAFGLEHFTGDAVIIYMADASDSPEDVVKYYEVLYHEADCVFGSRFMRGSKVTDYPRFKLVINRVANLVIQTMFKLSFNDVTNAFKGYRADVIKGCRPFVSPHFNLTIEIPLKAIVRGYSYRTLPISWRNRTHGTSSLRLKEQGSRYIYTLLTVWFEALLTREDYQRPAGEEFIPWIRETRTDAPEKVLSQG
jgi:dolichol-phosphate mannosyltransferase